MIRTCFLIRDYGSIGKSGLYVKEKGVKGVTRYGCLKFLNHRGFVKDARAGEAGLRGG